MYIQPDTTEKKAMFNYYLKTFLKICTLAITVLFLFTAANLSAQIPLDEDGETEGEIYKQDINGDGSANIVDVVALMLMGRDDPESPVADYTDDGEYGISDVTALLLNIMNGELSLPETFSITGRVVENDQGVGGVIMVGGSYTATDADGHYRFEVTDGKYEVKPIIRNWYYTFEPEAFEEIVVNGDSVVLPDIQATYAAFALSGRVVEGDLALEGVSVNVKGESMDTTLLTDSEGMFRLDSLLNAPYAIVPTLENYTFDPLTLAVHLKSDSLIQDIQATPVGATPAELHVLGGMVFCSVQPLSNVQVLLTGDMEAGTVTDAGGLYSFAVPDGNYTIIVVPIPLFQVFNPSSHAVVVQGQDITDLHFYGFGAGGGE